MAEIMQNFIVFIDEEATTSLRTSKRSSPRLEDTFDISLKGGKMCLNRFCIDENAAFELSGVRYLQSPAFNHFDNIDDSEKKGRENSFS